MKLLSRILGLHPEIERRGTHPGTAGWPSARSSSGPNVTVTGALALSAVWASVRLLANEVASIPLVLYRQRGNVRERATDHPLYGLLRWQSNRNMTAYIMIRTAMMHVASWGNAYVRSVWSDGYPRALYPLRPDYMIDIETRGDRLVYVYQEPGRPVQRLFDEEIMHLREISFDGIVGLSPIRVHMQTVGVGLAARDYAGSVYGNGAFPGGVLKYDGVLDADKRKALKQSWEDQYQGPEKFGKVAVLDKGWDFDPVSLPPQESRFIESQQWSVTEIARIYGVPPHLIQDLTHATFSNIEHQSLDFLYHTLRPWLTMWKEAVRAALLTPGEQETLYVDFLTADAVSVDLSARYAAYNIGVQTGILSINEVRQKENMNPVDGGDVHLVPLNLAPLGSPAAAGDATRGETDREMRSQPAACTCGADHGRKMFSRENRDDEDDPYGDLRSGRQALAMAQRDVFEDTARRIVRREVADIRRALDKHLRKRSVQDFTAWLEALYIELDPAIRDAFGPLLRSVAKIATREASLELAAEDLGLTETMIKFIVEYLEQMARHWTESSMGQLLALLNEVVAEGGGPEEIAEAIEERLTQWEERRPAKVGDNDPFEALNALLIMAYHGHQVRYLRWLASGTSCAFCQSLNGQIAGIEEYFVPAGTLIDAGPEIGRMRIRQSKRHGPLHRSCDCTICAA